MPEYGLCDKPPERLEEERFNKEMIASLKRAEAREAEAFQRKADAENSTIQTAEILRQMMEQMQEIRDTQEVEQQARMKSEKSSTKFQWANLILVALTLAVTIFFGFRSCSATSTSGVQGSRSVITNSSSGPRS